MRMFTCLLSLFAPLCVVIEGVAYAQSVPDEARILYDQGLKLYEQGNYRTAIQLWEKTYALTPLPAILHNIAKAQEESGDPKSALATWRRYLDVAPSQERSNATARIAALEIVVATLSSSGSPASEGSPTGVSVGDPGPSERTAEVKPPPEPKPPREPRSYRGLAVALMGVGATSAVVGGGALALQGQGRASDAATSGCVIYGGSTLCDDSTTQALSAGRLQFALGTLIIGGGVALGGGGVAVAVKPGGGADIVFSGRW